MSSALRRQLPPIALLLGAAVLCTFSAGNRLAELPGHAESRLSPSWFGAGNAQQRAIQNIDKRDFAGALHWSSIAVARNPIGLHSTSALALALLGTGHAEAAQKAYTVAAATGWRDVGVQTYWLMTSLAVGDYDVAAQRLDALLRVRNRDAQTLEGLAALESNATGRKALVERLRLSPDWTQWYLRSVGDLHDGDLDRRLTVIATAFRRGLRVDPADVAKAATALRLHGEIGAAVRLWTALGGDKDTGIAIADGNFENVSNNGTAGPFDWTLLETGGVDVRTDLDSPLHSGAALYVLSSVTTTRRVAQQALVLPPGTYAVRWNSAGSGGKRSSDIGVRLLCNGTSANTAGADIKPVARNGSVTTVTLPTVGCSSQLVAIEIRPSSVMSRSPNWIDDVSVTRVAAK